MIWRLDWRAFLQVVSFFLRRLNWFIESAILNGDQDVLVSWGNAVGNDEFRTEFSSHAQVDKFWVWNAQLFQSLFGFHYQIGNLRSVLNWVSVFFLVDFVPDWHTVKIDQDETFWAALCSETGNCCFNFLVSLKKNEKLEENKLPLTAIIIDNCLNFYL